MEGMMGTNDTWMGSNADVARAVVAMDIRMR